MLRRLLQATYQIRQVGVVALRLIHEREQIKIRSHGVTPLLNLPMRILKTNM
jgi:hypothetical protein